MNKKEMYDEITKLLKQEDFVFMNGDGFAIYCPKEYTQMMMKEGQLIKINIHTVEEDIIPKENKFDEVFGVSNVAS